MILETFRDMVEAVSLDLDFMVGDQFEANLALDNRDLFTRDIAIYNDRFTAPFILNQAQSLIETRPLEFMFLGQDEPESDPLETDKIVVRCWDYARRMAIQLDNDKVLKDRTRKLGRSSIAVIKHTYDADLSGALLTVEFPVRADFDRCFKEKTT